MAGVTITFLGVGLFRRNQGVLEARLPDATPKLSGKSKHWDETDADPHWPWLFAVPSAAGIAKGLVEIKLPLGGAYITLLGGAAPGPDGFTKIIDVNAIAPNLALRQSAETAKPEGPTATLVGMTAGVLEAWTTPIEWAFNGHLNGDIEPPTVNDAAQVLCWNSGLGTLVMDLAFPGLKIPITFDDKDWDAIYIANLDHEVPTQANVVIKYCTGTATLEDNDFKWVFQLLEPTDVTTPPEIEGRWKARLGDVAGDVKDLPRPRGNCVAPAPGAAAARAPLVGKCLGGRI